MSAEPGVGQGSAGAAPAEPAAERCRLCGGDLAPAFTAELMGRHQVRYGVCASCGSLQTEPPFWLHEAYASNLGDLDCGSAQRNLHNFAACFSLMRLFGLGTAIDFGGGDGLLTRLLRDRSIDCHVDDKYGSPTYALAFADAGAIEPEAIFAFEVVEHFVEPVTELAALFARRPAILFGTTQRFAGQGPDWWYLSRRSGHHVFFFSRQALELVARTHGYRLVQRDAFFLFIRADRYSRWRAAAARLLLSGLARRMAMAVLAFLPATGIGQDIALLNRRS